MQNLLNLLVIGDEIMAEKGFDILYKTCLHH